PMSRTWVKLGATAKAGDKKVILGGRIGNTAVYWDRDGRRVGADDDEVDGVGANVLQDAPTVAAAPEYRVRGDGPLESVALGDVDA
ncbi:MAG TPA: hypothetical protein PJ982_13455, partial [Lacipirellulaceae bacterium]|nr:hypothetical protein [Lacipirellulaceae bacterium]